VSFLSDGVSCRLNTFASNARLLGIVKGGRMNAFLVASPLLRQHCPRPGRKIGHCRSFSVASHHVRPLFFLPFTLPAVALFPLINIALPVAALSVVCCVYVNYSFQSPVPTYRISCSCPVLPPSLCLPSMILLFGLRNDPLFPFPSSSRFSQFSLSLQAVSAIA
jgi:hypothetical protein